MKKAVKIEKMSWASVKFARVLACVLTAGVMMSAVAQDAESVAFNYKMATARPGQTMTLGFTTEPAGATDGLVWSSSDESVVTVANGVATVPTAAQGGQATITVTCANGASASLIFDAATPLPEANVTIPIDYKYMNGNAVAGATEDWSDVVSAGLFEGSFSFFADNRTGFDKSYTYDGTSYTAYGFTNRLDVTSDTDGVIPFAFDGYQSEDKAFDGYDCLRFSSNTKEGIVDVVTTNYYSKWYVLGTGGGPGSGTYGLIDVIVHYSDGTTDSREFTVHDWVDNKNDATNSVSSIPQYRTGNADSSSGNGTAIGQNSWDDARSATVPYCGYYLHAMAIDTNPEKFVTELEMKLTGLSDGADGNSGYFAAFFASAGRTGGYLMMPRTALAAPAGASKIVRTTTLVGDWAAVEGATGYYYELSTTPNFTTNSVVYSGTTGADVNTATFTGLNPATTYYLRARAIFAEEDNVTRNSNISIATTASLDEVDMDELDNDQIIEYVFGSDAAAKLRLNIWDSNEFDANNEAKSLVSAVVAGDITNCPSNVTANVEYTLYTATDLEGEFTQVAAQTNDVDFVCDANANDQTFWKGHMKVTVTLKNDPTQSWTAECDSTNIVGLTRVASTNEWTPVAIAYDTPAWGVKNVTASNVVGLADLQVGDEMWTWDSQIGAYRVFLVTEEAGNKFWQSTELTVFRGKNGEVTNSVETAAESYEMNRGYGFWLKRATPIAEHIHAFGQVPYADAPDAVVTISAKANTLIGAQHYKKLQFVSGQAVPDSYRNVFKDKDMDVIQVKQTDGTLLEYSYMESLGGWMRYEYITLKGKQRLAVMDTFEIPLGIAFDYSNNSASDIELNWSAK